MNSFVKKEFTLNNMQSRKKTSTKIKTPSVQHFNYRVLSLPQKRSTINQNSFIRKKEKQKDSSEGYTSSYGSVNVHHKLVQRKNKSLPKYLCVDNKQKETEKDNKEKLNNYKNSPEYRLQTVEEIMQKKDSKIIIRNSLLRPKDSTQLTNKSKNQRITNFKNIFQNRKFTNLSKYSSKNQQKDRSDSKLKSKTKFSIHQDQQSQDEGLKTIRDIDLNNVIDPEVVMQVSQQKTNETSVFTLEHVYSEADKSLHLFYVEKNQQHLQVALNKLKHIEKHVGDMSKKAMLLMGRCYFQMKKYDDSIRYLQKVFRQVNYNLFKLKLSHYRSIFSISAKIYSKKTQQNKNLIVKKYEEFYQLLAQSYKKTDNFLCAIKILNQWQHFIVEKQIKDELKVKNLQQYNNRHQQKTISYLDDIQVNRLKKYSSNHNCSYYEYEIMKTNLQMSQRKKSLSKHSSSQHQHSKNFDSILIDRDYINYKTIQPKMSYSVAKSQQYFALLQNLAVYQKKSQFCKCYLMRARLHYQMKNYQNAIKDYNKAIVCDSLNLEANLELGSIYYKIGRGDKSIAHYQQFQQKIANLQIQSKRTLLDYIKFHKSVMYIKMSQFKQANQAFTQLEQNLSSNELMSQIFYYKGFILLNSGIYDEALIQFQKSINSSTSKKYIIYAYFLRVYIHFFKLNDYYGAQYELDRMKFTINTHKIHVQLEKIKLDELQGYYSLYDLMVFTNAVNCILKMKLVKGIEALTSLQFKFSSLTHATSQQPTPNSFYLSQMMQVIYQFMYFSYYTKRQYKKSLSYLVLLESNIRKQSNSSKVNLSFDLHHKLSQKQNSNNDINQNSSIVESERINHLTLQSIIMMNQNKYQFALEKIKQIQTITKCLQNKSSSFLLGQKDQQMNKDDNYLNMIKSICYIQLYDYLEKEQQTKKANNNQLTIISKEVKNNSIKINLTKPQIIKVQESNAQILLSAEDLLAHCLITDKQNFQILFLISAIHYELNQYQSSLNYIRQAIQFSDDHMIKHYYLKANLKLLLGRYEQAAKDYGNAITVYKELQKQVKNIPAQKNNTKLTELELYGDNSSRREYGLNEEMQQGQNCEYYEQKQKMIWEIHLNRAISYLKFSYEVQAETDKYISNRETINNMRQLAAQDVKAYFNNLLQQIKKYQPKPSFQQRSIEIQSKLQNYSKSTQTRHLKLSQQSLNITEVTQQQKNIVKHQKLKKKLEKNVELLSLLMHTPSVQHYLDISKDFLNAGYKITTDEQLLKYFYFSKELNNCLLIMQKIIKRSQSNLKQTDQEIQPFFKSKTKKQKKNSFHYSVNPTPFLPTNKVTKLKFDHCVLLALKQSSSNVEDDYEAALTQLLQCVQKVAQQRQNNERAQQNDFCGQIFKWADLLFFTGAMYFMLNEYDSALKYFTQSLSQRVNTSALYSGKNYIKHLTQTQDGQASQIDIQTLRLMEELFQNRTYTKQQIQYNIGICYIMLKEYKQAYNYLSIYPKFVDLIQVQLSDCEHQLNSDNSNRKQTIQQQEENEENDQEDDITPFPSHNRLCSIYNDKKIKNSLFKLSFCLPKIDLPKLNMFYQKQVEMANLIDLNKSQSETIFAQSRIKLEDQQQFPIIKQNMINFIQIISLQDIQMKPLAPWIKKQKKCIKFTQNILQQSIDLKTECNTGRSKKRHQKQLFGKQKQREMQKQTQIQKQKETKSVEVIAYKKQKKPAQRYAELDAKEE